MQKKEYIKLSKISYKNKSLAFSGATHMTSKSIKEGLPGLTPSGLLKIEAPGLTPSGYLKLSTRVDTVE